MFPGVTLSAGLFSTQAGIDSVTGPLAAKVLGNGTLHSQPAASTMTGPYTARPLRATAPVSSTD